MKQRGLKIAPEIAVGDGALGFWKALDEVFPGTRHQRCWVHKTANVLNKVALSVQANMKTDLREVYLAPNRASAEVAIDGEWHDVPNFALIDPKTNKLGYAVVWLQPRTSLQIQCFLPGAGG